MSALGKSRDSASGSANITDSAAAGTAEANGPGGSYGADRGGKHPAGLLNAAPTTLPRLSTGMRGAGSPDARQPAGQFTHAAGSDPAVHALAGAYGDPDDAAGQAHALAQWSSPAEDLGYDDAGTHGGRTVRKYRAAVTQAQGGLTPGEPPTSGLREGRRGGHGGSLHHLFPASDLPDDTAPEGSLYLGGLHEVTKHAPAPERLTSDFEPIGTGIASSVIDQSGNGAGTTAVPHQSAISAAFPNATVGHRRPVLKTASTGQALGNEVSAPVAYPEPGGPAEPSCATSVKEPADTVVPVAGGRKQQSTATTYSR